jgi:DNA-binding Xre family transcriptional regulator
MEYCMVISRNQPFSNEKLTSYSAVVGQVLANLRQEKDVKQGDLALAVGIGQSTWSRIEKGEVSLSIDQLARASKHLRCNPSDILSWADQSVARMVQDNVEVLDDKPVEVKEKSSNTGAVLLGAGALAALIWASRK